MAAISPLRVETYFPILTLAVSLTACVYLFEQLEQEKTDKRIGKALFIVSGILMLYFANKERLIVRENDVKLLYFFLMIGTIVVVASIVQDN